MVRAFAADAPPAKLAFYSAAAAACRRHAPAALPRLADLLRLNDAGLKALLGDWLRGLSTPRRASTTRWPQRAQLHARRGDHVRASGHAVIAAQRELLRARLRTGRPAGARAGDREPRPPAARPGADRRRGAQRAGARRGRLHRRLAAPGQPRAARPPRRRAARTSCRSRLLRLTQQAEQPRARSEQLAGELAEVDAQLEALQERRVTGRGAASRSSTCSWPTARSATPSWTTQVIDAERKLAGAREQQRSLERQAQEAAFPGAQRWRRARPSCSARIETAAAQVARQLAGERAARRRRTGAPRRRRRAGRPAERRWPLKLEREQALGALRSAVRRPDRQAARQPTSSA
ncbi:MAG: hypothetical protein MZW92_33825 [Comamonadaceae bacterium]|nr:hypothetical protein [Comamonadaceae bacterium]